MATNRNITNETARKISIEEGQSDTSTNQSGEGHGFIDRSRRTLERMSHLLQNSGRALDRTGRKIAAGGRASARIGRAIKGSRMVEENFGMESCRAPLNIYETNTQYLICVVLPGCTEDSVQVTQEGTDLWIKAWSEMETFDSTNTRMHLQETELGNWHRHIRLGRDIDTEGRITAKCCNGVLVISLPKKADTQRRNIHVDLA